MKLDFNTIFDICYMAHFFLQHFLTLFFYTFSVDGAGVASPGIGREIAAGSFALQGGN